MPTSVRGMSHALRTPLGVVLMSVEYLQSKGDSGVDVALLARVEEGVMVLVERLKTWSARAIEEENHPDRGAFSAWVREEVAAVADQVRALLAQSMPLELAVPPLRQARAGILNLVAAFERIYGQEKNPPAKMEPDVFAEQLRLGVLHSRKRETLPIVELELLHAEPIPTQYWIQAWTWLSQLEDRGLSVADWRLEIDAPVGLRLHLSGQTHSLAWK